MLSYSKSFRCSIRSRTENLYDRARKKLSSSFRATNVDGCRRRSSYLKKGDQFLINEDFVATAPGQLSVLSGQRVELLERLDTPSSSDVAGVRLPEDATATTSGNNRLLEPSTTTDDGEGGASADERMAVVALVGAAERARGAVPTRILTPARPTAGTVDAAERRDANSAPATSVDKSTAETSSSSSGGGSGGGANLSGSTASTQKRSSLRRFFNNNSNNNSALTSQQQQQSHSANVESGATGVNNNRNREEQQQGCCSTVTAAASTSSTTNSQQQSYSDNAPPSVLSATSSAATAALPLSADQSPLNQLPHFEADEDQPGTTTITTTTLTAATARDADLPPPMSQLNSAATATASYDSGGGDATTAGAPTSLPVTNSSAIADSGSFAAATALVSGNGAGSGAESAAGTPQEVAAATSAIDQMSPAEAARLKRQYVLNELVETERIYVQDLASVVDGYIGNLSSMELPEDLQGKDKIIFANIAQILDFHKTTFLKEIEKCLTDYEAAGNAFVKYERRLNAYYVKYCQNKPKSDFLVSQESFEQFFAETKQKLGHKVALADLLIKPIQRITKYQLMLKDIVKYTERAGDRLDVLNRALEVMRIVPKACDDMMQVGRLQNFEGNLNAQGRLLFQGTLLISDGSPSQPFRGKERRVFLFEQSAIIADYIPPRKEYGNPTYVFKNQIMVNKMVLEENVADEPLRFVLTSNDPAQPAAVFVAQAASAEDKRQWLAKISAQLDQQKTFLAALVDPKRYQSQLANSVGSLSLTGKKDSSSSLGAASTLPSNNNNSSAPHSATVGGFSSPRHNNTGGGKSKLFGFGKSKS